MTVKSITHGTEEYEEMIRLRITALLDPIGVPSSYIKREAEEHDLLIGAFDDLRLIGCCVLTDKHDGSVQLRQMAVQPTFQGKGYGARILEFAEKLAVENKFTSLILHARDPVINFYVKCGYQISGSQFFEVGIAHHKMVKKWFV